jgi:isoleucyl-tRNA synthetase
MVNSPILRGEDLIFSDKGVIETIRAVILPLWNAQSFLTTYAEADGWKPSDKHVLGQAPKVTAEMDKWIISRLHTMIDSVHSHMENYHLYAVVPVLLSFIDDLTNWYIRLSRRRFWGKQDAAKSGLDQDQISAYETLYYVVLEFTKVFAPFAPFVSEQVFRNLTAGVSQAPQSVHLADIPTVRKDLIDTGLEEQMNLIRRSTELGRALRAKHQIKTRQPLPSLLVITRNEQDRKIIDSGRSILIDELNVKSIEFSTDEARYVSLGVKPNLKTLGKKLGASIGQVRAEFEALSKDPQRVADFLSKAEKSGKASVAGFDLTTDDLLIDRGPKDDRLIATDRGVTVLLDVKLTDQLIGEGYAREVVSRIQNLRKESGLNVVDRISLSVVCGDGLKRAIETHRDYICGETLASKIEFKAEIPSNATRVESDIEGHAIQLGLVKI